MSMNLCKEDAINNVSWVWYWQWWINDVLEMWLSDVKFKTSHNFSILYQNTLSWRYDACDLRIVHSMSCNDMNICVAVVATVNEWIYMRCSTCVLWCMHTWYWLCCVKCDGSHCTWAHNQSAHIKAAHGECILIEWLRIQYTCIFQLWHALGALCMSSLLALLWW